MMSNLNSKFLGVFCVVCFMLSCASEPKRMDVETIKGRWEVYQAERGGKPTQTVNGAFFEFRDHNKMVTDILGEPVQTAYNLYDREIVQLSGGKIRYKVETVNDSTMTLSATIRKVDFVFDLIKTSTL